MESVNDELPETIDRHRGGGRARLPYHEGSNQCTILFLGNEGIAAERTTSEVEDTD